VKVCKVEKPLVATNRILGMEHKHLQVVLDGNILVKVIVPESQLTGSVT